MNQERVRIHKETQNENRANGEHNSQPLHPRADISNIYLHGSQGSL